MVDSIGGSYPIDMVVGQVIILFKSSHVIKSPLGKGIGFGGALLGDLGTLDKGAYWSLRQEEWGLMHVVCVDVAMAFHSTG